MSKKYTTNFLEDTNGSTGSANQVLISTAAGIDWVDGSGSAIIGGPYVTIGTNQTVTGIKSFSGKIGADGGIDGLTLANGGITGSNYNISGVNQLVISDPGEGIVFTGTATMYLNAVDDATDSILKLTNATQLNLNSTARITSLVNPTGAQDAATKNYVDTEIGNIPSGLAFEGNWNASTDTPTLAGTTQDNGKFWIVTVAGSTNLSGITDWAVGDWAIYVDNGAGTDAWQKVDNSSTLSGLGAANKVAFWSTTANVSFNNNFSYDGTNLTVPRLRVGDGTDGYFYSDSAGRTAFTGGNFYIQSGVSTYYNYANTQYHGNSSGDNHLFRGNPLSGNNWSITAAGAISAASTITASGGFLVPYTPGTKKPMINLAGATNYGLWHTEASNDIFSFDFGGVSKQQFFQSGNATFAGDLTVSGGDIVLGGTGRIQGVDTVSASTDAANKAYVDNAIAGVPQGTVTGSGVNQRLAFWNGTSSLSSDDELTWDGVNLNIGTYAGTGDCELRLFGSTPNNSFSTLKTTNGNLHIDSDNGHTVYLNYYSGGSTSVIIGNGAGGSSNTVFYANGNVGVGADLTVSGGDIILSGTGRIQGVDTVSAGTDAANKTYVDTKLSLTGGTMANTNLVTNMNADLLDGKDHTAFGATLATYGSTAGASGRIRITAPFNTNSSHMFQITVSIYSNYTIHTYVVGGYMYSSTNNWYSPKAVYSGTGTPDIVVGRDSNGKAYISIANGNYTGVRVHNMTLGYQTNIADTYDPWAITIDGATPNSVAVSVYNTWTSGNDGAGSGLDADLLDGQQGSYYASAASIGNGQIDGRTSGLGLSGSMDATANQSGNTTFTVTSNATTAATANTIAYRNSSADIRARLFRSNYQNQSTISGGIAYRVNNGADDYIRFCTDKGAIRTFLGVPASGDLNNYLLNTTDTLTGSLSVTAQVITDSITLTGSFYSRVSNSTLALQRMDTRVDATNYSRTHWYGISDTGATSNFRHAYYDGANYINVTAASGRLTFAGKVAGSTPTAAGDLATKAYVDNAVAGVPQGDITAVTAGTFLTGGGTSGDVTLNADASKLAHIVDSSNGSVTSGWITVAQASGSRKAGEVYVTDGESSDHSYIRIEWMRSYADSNFTVLNCGGHANRIQGVRVLEDTSDKTYGKKYLQVKVTATSNYYVIVTAPGTIPNYGDFIAETPVLENSKTGYNIKGNTLEDLQNSSIGSEQGITSGGNIELNDARYVFTKGDVLSLSAGGAGVGTEIVLDDPGSVIKLNSDTIAKDTFIVSSLTDGTGDDVFIANSNLGTFTLGDTAGIGDEALITGDTSSIYIKTNGTSSLIADSSNDISIPNGNLLISNQIIHTGDTNTYMQFHAADQWRVVTGGVERLEVNNSAVTVSGNARVTGAYYDSNNSPGTSGQVLSSTATGTDWVSAGGTSGLAPMVKFNRSGINSSTYTMIATVNGNSLSSVLKMTMTGTSNGVVFACTFDITVNHHKDIHVKSSNGDYTEVTLRITSNDNEDFSIEAKHNGSTTTQAEVCIFPLADEIITPTTTDPGYTGAEYEHTATEGWRYGGEDNDVESSNVVVDGKIGIGTTSPDEMLHIENSSGANIILNSNTGAVNNGIYMSEGTSSTPTQNGAYFYYDSSANAVKLDTGTSSLSTKLTVSRDSGNVGIGTTSPSSKLHVNYEDAESVLTISRGGTNLSAGTAIGTIQFNADYQGSPISYGSIDMYANSLSGVRSSLDFNVKSTSGGIQTGLTVQGNSGTPRVGIGTTSPGAKLDVVGNGNAIQIRRSNGFASIKAHSDNGGNLILDSDSSGSVFINNYVNRPVYIATGGGNVGIGTTSPGDKLHVNGTVRSQAPATSDWALLGYNSAGSAASGLWFDNGDGELLLRDDSGNLNVRLRSDTSSYINGGNLGIGTTSPAQKLTVNGRFLSQGTSTPIYIKVSSAYKSWVHHIGGGDEYIFAPSTVDGGETWDWANQVRFNTLGVVQANNFVLASDKRLKKNIKDVSNKRIKANWKTFEMIADETKAQRHGVIAQELEKVHPEFVRTDNDGMKSVAYTDLLIAKIAELEARLEKLEK